MIRLSYWVIPILAGTVWLAMLLALLLYWVVDTHETHYGSMDATQRIAYISDVGAAELKPLFIAGCVITTVLLDLSFGLDRWLRHKGRLAPNTTTAEKVLSGLTIAFAVVGTVGLILLSIFDTARYPRLHDIFLLLFIAGYVLSAIFICWEYQRLGMRHREHRVLRRSFYIKLAFVVVEILLAIAFVACTFKGRYNPGAVLEWVIAFIFSAYVFSFYVDLYPAAATKPQLQVSAGGKSGGLKMRLAGPGRMGRRRGGNGGGGGHRAYGASLEMEEGASDATLSPADGAGSFDAARVHHGLQHGVRPDSRGMGAARNF